LVYSERGGGKGGHNMVDYERIWTGEKMQANRGEKERGRKQIR
jgi:hypothetical protein